MARRAYRRASSGPPPDTPRLRTRGGAALRLGRFAGPPAGEASGSVGPEEPPVPNFYRDDADLPFHMRHVDWGGIVPLLEDDYALAAEGGPSDLAEARETHEAVLDLVG